MGVGLGQAQDAQSIVIAALEAAAVLTVLELLWLESNVTWLEQFVDFASVIAASKTVEPATADGKAPARRMRGNPLRLLQVCHSYNIFANAVS